MQLRGAMLMNELHQETWEKTLERVYGARCETADYLELDMVEGDNMLG
jgi:hypothetical protein